MGMAKGKPLGSPINVARGLKIASKEVDRQSVRHLWAAKTPLARLSAVVLVLMCCSVGIQAQTIFGRISGTVQDKQGAVVPNASITVTNTATNLVRTTATNGSGFYTVTNLPPGTYTVLAELKGFKKAFQGDNVLVADARLTVDVTLEPGELSEAVQVATTSGGETVNT